MSEVKRYHVTEAGLAEGQALGRINVVLGTDYDSAVQCFLTAAEGCVAAERRERALQQRLTAADEANDMLSTAYVRAGEREHELRLRVHLLEGLLLALPDGLKDLSGCENTAGVVACIQYVEYLIGELKPAEGGGDEVICTLCMDQKTIKASSSPWVQDCPDCCGEEG